MRTMPKPQTHTIHFSNCLFRLCAAVPLVEMIQFVAMFTEEEKSAQSACIYVLWSKILWIILKVYVIHGTITIMIKSIFFQIIPVVPCKYTKHTKYPSPDNTFLFVLLKYVHFIVLLFIVVRFSWRWIIYLGTVISMACTHQVSLSCRCVDILQEMFAHLSAWYFLAKPLTLGWSHVYDYLWYKVCCTCSHSV